MKMFKITITLILLKSSFVLAATQVPDKPPGKTEADAACLPGVCRAPVSDYALTSNREQDKRVVDAILRGETPATATEGTK